VTKKINKTIDATIFKNSLYESFKKIDPRSIIKNPIMFVTWIGAMLCTVACLNDLLSLKFSGFNWQISMWLWFTVLFANFAEAIAEGRSKAQAEGLKQGRAHLFARKISNLLEEKVPATDLKIGDIVVCESNDVVPADGEVIEGIASIDESAITGESAPVIRESGGDRSAVTGGTRVISDRIVMRITAALGNTFMDRIIGLIENARRLKTPNEIALTIVLCAFSLILLLAVASLKLFADYSANAAHQDLSGIVSVPVLVALLVCLIPTTIGGLLSAIGIAGMNRLIEKNVIAKSGRAIEAAGDIDMLLIDKTGTITLGNRMATAFIPNNGISEKELAQSAQLASLADETPEGRSVVILAKEKFQLRAESLHPSQARFIAFSADTKMSGVDLIGAEGQVISSIRKGAVESILKLSTPNTLSLSLKTAIDNICRTGGTPLAVAQNQKIIGVIHLKDIVKGGIKEKFQELRKIGIRTVMITGDNPMTAAAIAAEAGIDDFIAECTPETKLEHIRSEQKKGYLVAMTGDGTNDAPALAQSDVGIAMNTGTQAAREAGNMVDLDSSPTKIIDIVEIGKQLLVTRGALTTFSITNDIAKYFAILPAIFMGLYPHVPGSTGPLASLNIMNLHSPESAILSAVIFNALIIIFLIPLALSGVAYKPQVAAVVLSRNLSLYGLSGIITPFIGIKIIDLMLVFLGWA